MSISLDINIYVVLYLRVAEKPDRSRCSIKMPRQSLFYIHTAFSNANFWCNSSYLCLSYGHLTVVSGPAHAYIPLLDSWKHTAETRNFSEVLKSVSESNSNYSPLTGVATYLTATYSIQFIIGVTGLRTNLSVGNILIASLPFPVWPNQYPKNKGRFIGCAATAYRSSAALRRRINGSIR